MKKVKLESLELVNFKGQQYFKSELNGENAFFHAKNRGGKTTMLSAYTWLLFGKDAEWNSDFSVKTWDENNNVIPNLEHMVQGRFSDGSGSTFALKKVLQEKWVKRRGEVEETFTGNEITYFVNDVPVKQSEYKEMVEKYLCPEDVARLLTSVTYFPTMKKEQRRAFLEKMIGEIKDENLPKSATKFNELITRISGKDYLMYKREISQKRTRLKDEEKTIQPRIEEAQRGSESGEEVNYDLIQKQVEEKESAYKQISLEIESTVEADRKKNQSIQEYNNQIYQKKQEANRIYSDTKVELEGKGTQYQSKLTSAKRLQESNLAERESFQKRKSAIDSEIVNVNTDIVALRDEWKKVNERTFEINPNETVCPTCNRELENSDEKIKELQEKFNTDKKESLDRINKKGIALKELLEEKNKVSKQLTDGILLIQEDISQQEKEIANLESLIAQQEKPNVTEYLKTNQAYQDLLLEIAKMEQTATAMITTNTDISESKQKQQALLSEIQELKISLSKKDDKAKIEARIQELISEKRRLSQEIANLEKDEDIIQSYEDEKNTYLEQQVNKLFSFCQIRMFEKLINGSYNPTCDILINGVPYVEANTESKVNAGLDIIRVLTNHYSISIPVWIDNRESVTEIIQVESQVINLVVDPTKETLTLM